MFDWLFFYNDNEQAALLWEAVQDIIQTLLAHTIKLSHIH